MLSDDFRINIRKFEILSKCIKTKLKILTSFNFINVNFMLNIRKLKKKKKKRKKKKEKKRKRI